MITKIRKRTRPPEIVKAHENRERYIKEMTNVFFSRNWTSQNISREEFLASNTTEHTFALYLEAEDRVKSSVDTWDIRKFINMY